MGESAAGRPQADLPNFREGSKAEVLQTPKIFVIPAADVERAVAAADRDVDGNLAVLADHSCARSSSEALSARPLSPFGTAPPLAGEHARLVTGSTALYIGPSMDDLRLKKLKYRAEHRGFREADIIIGGFAEKHLHELTTAQLDEFERLIDQPDPDLYAWIIGRQPIPEEFDGEVMDLIRTFRFFAHTTIGAHRGA